MSTPALDEIIVTLDLATNKLVARGQNFTLTCDRDADLGERIRAVLRVRAVEATRGFATNGAPSVEWQRHRFLHKTNNTKGCPWCAEHQLKASKRAVEAEAEAKTMAQARKLAEKRKAKARAKQQAELKAALGIL